MKLFLSHSSRCKPLVRELRSYLPEHVVSWIDEKQLVVGDDLESSIEHAICAESDYVVLFIDEYAVRSAWVQRELTWALEQETRLGRPFILPVVLDHDSWMKVEPEAFQQRKYVACEDFTEETIRTLATNLVAQLFAAMSRDLALSRAAQPVRSTISMLDEADKYLVQLANEIRIIANAYSRNNPLTLDELFEGVKGIREYSSLDENRFQGLLGRLRTQGYLSGLAFTEAGIYVEEEHFSWKSMSDMDAKQAIARKAASYIHSNNTVLLDAGSTTLEIARHVAKSMKMRLIHGLTIITNSVCAAYELSVTASDMGLEDNNDVIRVFLPGGKIRCNTLAIAPGTAAGSEAVDDLRRLGEDLGGVDLAFIGTNGIDIENGFTTHERVEADCKEVMLRLARRKCIVSQAAKFGVVLEETFASLDQPIEILTTWMNTDSQLQIQKAIEMLPSTLTFC
jgi:DeoR/GlpR family transcriptional regulator of sugar metabolism